MQKTYHILDLLAEFFYKGYLSMKHRTQQVWKFTKRTTNFRSQRRLSSGSRTEQFRWCSSEIFYCRSTVNSLCIVSTGMLFERIIWYTLLTFRQNTYLLVSLHHAMCWYTGGKSCKCIRVTYHVCWRCATLADCRLADLQTADLQTCRLADLQTFRLLWRTERIINLSCTEKSNVCYGQFYMTGLIILLEVRCTFCVTK